MTKRLTYPSPELRNWPDFPRNVLTEAIRCVAQAEADLFGEHSEKGASYHTLMLPGLGRLFAKESVLKKWFREHFEVYACFMAEHLVANPALGWMDIAVLAVPFRRDRLCLTLTLDPTQTPSQGAASPPGAVQSPVEAPLAKLYWNWTGPRALWSYTDPAAAERTFHLVGTIPYIEGFRTGFRMSRKEIQALQILPANPARLPSPPSLVLVPSAEIRPPAAPVGPSKRLRPEGGPAQPQEKPPTIDVGDARIFEETQETGRDPLDAVHQLPDGRTIEIVDWNDLSLPLGKRVQSKVAVLMSVDHLNGEVCWASEEQLSRFPHYADRGRNNSAVPGKSIKDMHFKTQLGGAVILRKNRLLWAYWTGEVPEEIRQLTYIHSDVPSGALNGIYNLIAKGWVAGSKEEEKVFFEKGYRGRKDEWRTTEDKKVLPVVKDRKYSKSAPAEFRSTGSPGTEIENGKRIFNVLASTFAIKAKRGSLTTEQAYQRAVKMSMDFAWKSFTSKEEMEIEGAESIEKRAAEMRGWVEPEELNRLNSAYADFRKSDAQVGALRVGVGMRDPRTIERYGSFKECWLTFKELATGMIQEEFRNSLGLLPKDYGQTEVDLFAISDERREAYVRK